jgi:hypothetical protein
MSSCKVARSQPSVLPSFCVGSALASTNLKPSSETASVGQSTTTFTGVRLVPLLAGGLMLVSGVAADRLISNEAVITATRTIEVVSAEHQSAISVPRGTVWALESEKELARTTAQKIALSTRTSAGVTELVFELTGANTTQLDRDLLASVEDYKAARLRAARPDLERRKNQIEIRSAELASNETALTAALGPIDQVPLDEFINQAFTEGVDPGALAAQEGVDGAEALQLLMQREGGRGEMEVLDNERAVIDAGVADVLFPAGSISSISSRAQPPQMWPTIIVLAGFLNVLVGLWVAHWKTGLAVSFVVAALGIASFATARTVISRARALESRVSQLQIPASAEPEEASKLAKNLNDLDASARDLRDSLESRLLAPMEVTRWLGAQREAVTQLSDDLVAATSGAARLTNTIATIAADSPTIAPTRVRAANDVARELNDLRSELEQRPGPDYSGLVGPLRRAATQYQETRADVLSRTQGTSTVVDGLARLTSANGTYLFVAGNTAENRAGTGAFLMLGEAKLSNGSMVLSELREVSTDTSARVIGRTPPGAVSIPDADIERNLGYLAYSRIWTTLGLSPRFPVNAEIAADMWESITGTSIDGVIYIDTMSVAPLIAITGDITVDGEVFSADTVTEQLLTKQYESLGGSPERQDKLRRFTAVLFAQLLSSATPSNALEPLRTSANERHLMIWSRDSVIQDGSRAMRTDGDIGSLDLGFFPANLDGKFDPFLDVSGAIATRCSASGQVELTLTTSISYVASPPISDYADGSFRLATAPRTFVGLTLTVLPAASQVTMGQPRNLVIDAPDGRARSRAELILLSPGQRWTGEVTMTLPSVDALRLLPDARSRPIAWTLPRAPVERSTGRWLPLPNC